MIDTRNRSVLGVNIKLAKQKKQIEKKEQKTAQWLEKQNNHVDLCNKATLKHFYASCSSFEVRLIEFLQSQVPAYRESAKEVERTRSVLQYFQL